MDTDEKNAELFKKGCSAQLQERLVLFCDLTFNALVSDCLDVEEKKRKRVMSGPLGGIFGGAPPKYYLVYTLPVGQPRRPSPPQWDHHPQ
jgi:hypothetical protein